MGSLLGGGSAKRAAQRQADAADRQTKLQTETTNYQIKAMSDQMAQAAAQQAANEYANKLLGTPIENVDVTLGTSDLDLKTDNLLGRRRTTRQAYQRPIASMFSRVVPTANSRISNFNSLL